MCLLSGTSGKTTTAWLIRGIFEEWGKLTGMAGSIENALYADKLDRDGNLWAPQEPDPTIDRRARRCPHHLPFCKALMRRRHLPWIVTGQWAQGGAADVACPDNPWTLSKECLLFTNQSGTVYKTFLRNSP